jgi:hypothetical protein
LKQSSMNAHIPFRDIGQKNGAGLRYFVLDAALRHMG